MSAATMVDSHQHTMAHPQARTYPGISVLWTTIVLVMTLWTVPAGAFFFESSKELAASAAVTMSAAVRTAVQAMPGKAVEAAIGKEEGRIVYEIKIIDMQSLTRMVYVDALSGQAMKHED